VKERVSGLNTKIATRCINRIEENKSAAHAKSTYDGFSGTQDTKFLKKESVIYVMSK
jgi:hypothetical protein